MATTKKKEIAPSLTPKQELFCTLYASDREFFGNGTESYMEAYGDELSKSKPNWYRTASAAAARLLVNVRILARINELIDSTGLNDQHVDKQLYFVLTQNADFSSKVAALREYNKLKQRIVERQDLTSAGEKLESLVIIKGNASTTQ